MGSTTLVAVKTVLVADATAFVRDRFRAAVEAAGHRAVTVRTGPELLARLRAEDDPVDLVVLDLRLPQGRGVNLVRAIRALGITSPPAIVVFSGTIGSADEVRQLASLAISGYVNEYTAAHHILPSLAPHLFPDRHNRRRSPRVTIGIPVSYRSGNRIAGSLTLNIGRGGLAARTTTPLEPGTTLQVRLRLPGSRRELSAEARVAWVDQRVGMGLAFTSVDPSAQAELDAFIDSHFFSNRKA